MKNIIIILTVTLIVVVSSCNNNGKNREEPPTPTTPTGTLELHLHTEVNNVEIGFDTAYTATNGRTIVVDTAQLYISHIQLLGSGSSVVYSVPNITLFKTQPIEVYMVGTVPVGQYQSIKFDVGLDSVANASTPSPGDTVFNQQSMFLNGSSTPQPGGYAFIYFSGYIDTTAAKTGSWVSTTNHTGFAKFSYKIGTNKNLTTVTMPAQSYTVASGQIQFVHIIINYDELFNGIDVTQLVNLTINASNENSTLARTALQNVQPNVVFGYEY